MSTVNERSLALGKEPSAIRQLFAYGLERKAAIGADKVFDFSIGNPSVPAPPSVGEAIVRLGQADPVSVHGYSPSQGIPSVREAVARSLNRRFATGYTAANIYMTSGASTSIGIAMGAVLDPGDEVIVIAPYFPEYRVWTESAQCRCIEVMAREDDFQIDITAIEEVITPRTRMIIVNSPNNPVGTVYTRANLEELCSVLGAKQDEYGTDIYLLADEPYRELAYDGIEVPWVPALYPNTMVCYSWSKSLSLPGERIGYLLVPDTMPGWEEVFTAACGAGRASHFICAPVLSQQVVASCIDEPADLASYEENRRALTQMMDRLGYTYIEPDGAFYLWVRALELDARAFSDRAKSHELLIVPSDSFGMTGWVRLSYCVSLETIKNAEPAFAALKADYE